jgi:hypothetical protein
VNFGALTLPLGPAYDPFRDAIAPAVERDPCDSIDDVMLDVESGKAQAWVATEGTAIRGACVTQILGGSKAKQCFIRHCAGEGASEWVDFVGVIENWARLEGCDSIELIGREGWQRLLGWERPAVVLRKGLN